MQKLKLNNEHAARRWVAFLKRSGIKQPYDLPTAFPAIVHYSVSYEGNLDYSYTYKSDFDETGDK